MKLCLAEVSELVHLRDVPIPADVRFRQIVVTGVPGSGKTTLVTRIGGWPEEGFLDLAMDRWWKTPMLTLRPREVHLGLPVAGHDRSLAVTDAEWLAGRPAVELGRIRIPPAKRGWLGTDWRGRYAFDFQLPPARRVYEVRQERERLGTHPVDRGVTLEQVHGQICAYGRVAWHLHREGVSVYVREDYLGAPHRIAEVS